MESYFRINANNGNLISALSRSTVFQRSIFPHVASGALLNKLSLWTKKGKLVSTGRIGSCKTADRDLNPKEYAMTTRSVLGLFCLTIASGCAGRDSATSEPRPVLAELCEPDACEGPAPLSPRYECPDGSIAGPACARAEDGTCEWTILECEGDEACTIEECGEPPRGEGTGDDRADRDGGASGEGTIEPSEVCADGSIAGLSCQRLKDDSCGWIQVTCDDEPDACECPDPAPGAPNFLCDDGETLAGPACVLVGEDVCDWTFIDCPTA
jgi:hypothetical protein